MQRSLPGDKYLADAFGKNWRTIHPNQSLRLVDFQMKKINSEVNHLMFFVNKMSNSSSFFGFTALRYFLILIMLESKDIVKLQS